MNICKNGVTVRNSRKYVGIVVALMMVAALLFARPSWSVSGRCIIVTFDDGGLQEATDQTVSIMDSYGYKGVVMATVAWTAPTVAVWAHILGEGWEIGCHGYTHANPNMLSASQLVHEVSDSKAWLEQAFGTTVISFGYPGSDGSDNQTVLNALRNAGYLYARETTYHYYWDGQRSLQVVGWFCTTSNYVSQVQSAINAANQYVVSVLALHGVNPNYDPPYTLLPAQFEYCLTQIRNAGLTVVTFKEWDQIKYGAPTPPPPSPPLSPPGNAPEWSDECDSLATWNTGGITVSTSGHHGGCFQETTGVWAGGSCSKTWASSFSSGYARAYVMFDHMPVNKGFILIGPTFTVAPMTNLAMAGIIKDATGTHWVIRTEYGGINHAISTVTPSANTWYCVELYFNRASNTATLYVNDSPVCTSTYSLGATDANTLQILGFTQTESFTLKEDCVKISASKIPMEGNIPPPTPPPPPTSAILTSSFENGFTGWSGAYVTGATMTTGAAGTRSGTAGCIISGLDAPREYGIAALKVSPLPSLYTQAYVWFTKEIAVDSMMFILQTSGGSMTRLCIYRAGNGGYHWMIENCPDGSSTITRYWRAAPFSGIAGRWIRVALGVAKGSTGQVTAYIDNEQIITQTANMGPTGLSETRVEATHVWGNPIAGTVYFDDVTVADNFEAIKN